jgi:hypothetical protein
MINELVFTYVIWKFLSTKKFCTRMFMEALFITVKMWIQAAYPSIYEFINKKFTDI